MLKKLGLIARLIAEGRIRLGMTRKELFAVLGPPDDVGVTYGEYKVPSLYKYGSVEFAFPDARTEAESEEEGLWLVYIDDGYHGDEFFDDPFTLLK